MDQRRNMQYRSLFWPVILIGIGVLWLLINLNIIVDVHWSILWRMWPLLLIGIGLDLLIGRHSQIIGAMVGLLIVAIAFGGMVMAPSLGWMPEVDVITEQFSESVGAAERAQVSLDLSVGPSTVQTAVEESQLIEANITHVGEIEFEVSGEGEKVIRLRQIDPAFGFEWVDFLDKRDLRWEIGLTPSIPLDLNLNGGVGESNLDLRELKLVDLDVNVGVGDIHLRLPAMPESYHADIDGSVGDIRITVEPETAMVLGVDGGVGDTVIELPSDAAVRVQADTGVGNVRLPSDFLRISGDNDNPVGDEGVWESKNFDDAERQIFIIFDGGVGNLTIRY